MPSPAPDHPRSPSGIRHALQQGVLEVAELLRALRDRAGGTGGGDVADRLTNARTRLRARAEDAARLAEQGSLATEALLVCPPPPAGADAETREDIAVVFGEVERWFAEARRAR